jgi:hypothetical protein
MFTTYEQLYQFDIYNKTSMEKTGFKNIHKIVSFNLFLYLKDDLNIK